MLVVLQLYCPFLGKKKSSIQFKNSFPIEHLSVMPLPLDGAITRVRAVNLCIDIPIGET